MQKCKNDDEVYDLKVLENATHNLDRLVSYVVQDNKRRLKNHMGSESRVLKGFYDVTPQLVNDFKNEANGHIKHLQSRTTTYGFLYLMADEKDPWTNAVHFDYENFPLMRDKASVLGTIRKMAMQFSPPNTNHFDATCLYLLYFYALLVNPNRNWITMDYISNGNRYHQYGTRLDWTKPVTQQKYA